MTSLKVSGHTKVKVSRERSTGTSLGPAQGWRVIEQVSDTLKERKSVSRIQRKTYDAGMQMTSLMETEQRNDYQHARISQ